MWNMAGGCYHLKEVQFSSTTTIITVHPSSGVHATNSSTEADTGRLAIRGNSICSSPMYTSAVIKCCPTLSSLDGAEIQRESMQDAMVNLQEAQAYIDSLRYDPRKATDESVLIMDRAKLPTGGTGMSCASPYTPSDYKSQLQLLQNVKRELEKKLQEEQIAREQDRQELQRLHASTPPQQAFIELEQKLSLAQREVIELKEQLHAVSDINHHQHELLSRYQREEAEKQKKERRLMQDLAKVDVEFQRRRKAHEFLQAEHNKTKIKNAELESEVAQFRLRESLLQQQLAETSSQLQQQHATELAQCQERQRELEKQRDAIQVLVFFSMVESNVL